MISSTVSVRRFDLTDHIELINFDKDFTITREEWSLCIDTVAEWDVPTSNITKHSGHTSKTYRILLEHG